MKWLIVLLFISLGFIFIVLEVLVTPGLIMGIIGAGLMIAGIVMSYAYYSTAVATAITIGSVLVTLIFFIAAWKMGAWKALMQRSTIDSKDVQVKTFNLAVGMEGITESILRPTGTAVFGGTRADVMSDGAFIQSNTKIRIAKIQDNKIIVKPI